MAFTELLTSTQAYSASAIILVLYLVGSTALDWYRLRHIKGPFIATFSYFWLFRNSSSARHSDGFRAVAKKYGPLARIGPNEVLTSDPEVVRRMGNTRAKPNYGRSSWYSVSSVDPYHPSLFSTLDTQGHDKLKAKLSFGYGGRENPSLEPGIDEQLVSLVDLIRRKYISTDTELRPLDLATAVQYFTLDTITKIAYGHAFGYLETDSDVYGYIAMTEMITHPIILAGEIPWIGKILGSPTFLKYFGPKTTDESGFGKMLSIAHDIASARFEPGAPDHNDMLGSFKRHGVELRDCQSEILFQIVAGSDTTAGVIRSTMLNLITSPQIYLKLQKEIDESIANGKISDLARAEEGRKLPYLQAVIYEGIRINPPFTGLAFKQVPPEGDTINGQFVPGGTRVGTNFVHIQRSTSIFGGDAEMFRPERWLNLDDATTMQWRHHVELAFGSGRWGCSGKPVAFLELNKVYIELLRRFDFQVVNPRNPVDTMNKNLVLQKNMWVRVTERFPGAVV
ncbi:related to pisatin demethylase [Cephalotrichum gorgonifer]|uniref:Cytochrome P450 monooxygenase ABA1 n=1 Tax=Cephalotrichum gorgonifer TaxID=2041049 RepID=A0AAE8MYN2_9PEZI|nr:related to pisatin demethylase [Cephalotrichum gorgonifer]